MAENFSWRGGEQGTKTFQKLKALSLQPPGTIGEVVFGVNNLRHIYVLSRALVAAKCVCKLTSGPASAFLIGLDTLITNNHVLPCVESAVGCKAQFNYEISPEGISLPVDEFELDTDSLFITSIEHDFTVVKVKGMPGLKWGFISLRKQDPKEGNAAFIVQHPTGGHKQISLGDNEIKALVENGTKIQYLSDSSPGSSGSPVFNEDFRLIGLHHASVLTPDNLRYFRNQAIHINAIIDTLPGNLT